MIRLVFSKKGLAKYISHLDMQRTMQRTLRRAGIPVWYSEGFNPHPYLCFASPLSVGIEGENEIIDFRLAEEMPFEEMKSRFNQAFPQGFTAKDIYEGFDPVKNIAFAEYTLSFPKDTQPAFEKFWQRDSIPVLKKTKRAQKEIDLKEESQTVSLAENGDFFDFTVILPCGSEKNINPQLIVSALEENIGKINSCRIIRNRFYKMDLSIFQ